MARKLRGAEEASNEMLATLVDGNVKSGNVSRMQVSSRKVVTLDGWEGTAALNVVGAIVRVNPPATSTDEQVADVKKRLIDAGAVAVKVMPRASAGSVVKPQTEDRSSVMTVRGTVMGMIDEARVVDRDALRAVVEEALVQEGL